MATRKRQNLETVEASDILNSVTGGIHSNDPIEGVENLRKEAERLRKAFARAHTELTGAEKTKKLRELATDAGEYLKQVKAAEKEFKVVSKTLATSDPRLHSNLLEFFTENTLDADKLKQMLRGENLVGAKAVAPIAPVVSTPNGNMVIEKADDLIQQRVEAVTPKAVTGPLDSMVDDYYETYAKGSVPPSKSRQLFAEGLDELDRLPLKIGGAVDVAADAALAKGAVETGLKAAAKKAIQKGAGFGSKALGFLPVVGEVVSVALLVNEVIDGTAGKRTRRNEELAGAILTANQQSQDGSLLRSEELLSQSLTKIGKINSEQDYANVKRSADNAMLLNDILNDKRTSILKAGVRIPPSPQELVNAVLQS